MELLASNEPAARKNSVLELKRQKQQSIETIHRPEHTADSDIF